MVRGTAIRIMCSGLLRIVSPWKANRSINISSKPVVVAPSNLGKNFSSKYCSPFLLVTYNLVSIPAARGITTNNTTDKINVSLEQIHH